MLDLKRTSARNNVHARHTICQHILAPLREVVMPHLPPPERDAPLPIVRQALRMRTSRRVPSLTTSADAIIPTAKYTTEAPEPVTGYVMKCIV